MDVEGNGYVLIWGTTPRGTDENQEKNLSKYQCPRLGTSWTQARSITAWASLLGNADRSQVSDNQVTCAHKRHVYLPHTMSVSSGHSDFQTKKNPEEKIFPLTGSTKVLDYTFGTASNIEGTAYNVRKEEQSSNWPTELWAKCSTDHNWSCQVK